MKYLKYSGIWFGLVVNPFHWEFRFQSITPDDMNPKQYGVFISIGPIWVRLIVDDGSW